MGKGSKKLNNTDTFRDDNVVNLDDGSWDYYSDLPNPKRYDKDSWVDED